MWNMVKFWLFAVKPLEIEGFGLLKSEKIRFRFVFIYFINDGRKIANHLYAD